jgi:hypothetical protein
VALFRKGKGRVPGLFTGMIIATALIRVYLNHFQMNTDIKF